jgi:hypothetical protein
MASLRPPSPGNGRARRRSVAALAALLWSAFAAPAPGMAEQASLEYAVKANYLYKLGPFVEWPPGAFAGPASPFNVCILGDDPFGQTLEEAVGRQTVDGRPVAVRRLTAISGVPACHVLYLGRTRSQAADDALKALHGAPVLTVTDEGQGSHGGVVHFVLRGGRVRFGLDVALARANGLTISSKLQSLSIAPRGDAK